MFKENQLTVIDRTIRLFPTVKDLVLDKNKLESIAHLSHLNNLQILSLRCNRIAQCANWHVQLGNLVTLNLSQNRIRLLEGLGKLYSLVNLDLSCNLIDDINEIDYIGNLPLLENLRLMGNPVAGGVGKLWSVCGAAKCHCDCHKKKSDLKQKCPCHVLNTRHPSKT